MTSPTPQRRRLRRMAVALVLSLLVHLAVLRALPKLELDEEEVTVVTQLVVDDEEPEPDDAEDAPEPERVERPETEDEPDAPPRPEAQQAPAQVAVVVEPAPAAEEEPPEPTPPSPERLPSVAQPDRDSEPPDVAEFLADVDNRADTQTMAEDTTLFDEAETVESAAESEAEDDPGEPVERTAANEIDDVPRWEDRPEFASAATGAEDGVEGAEADEAGSAETDVDEVAGADDEVVAGAPSTPEVAVAEADEGANASPTPAPALTPADAIARARAAASAGGPVPRGLQNGVDGDAYREVFAGRDARDRARASRDAARDSLFGDGQARWDRTRAALENFDVHVTPGSETNLNTRADAIAGYIHHLHNQIHDEWWGYLRQLDLYADAEDAVSDLSLMAVLEFGITRHGDVDVVRIVDGSGVLPFDARAVDLVYEAGPVRPPPPGMISSDGRAYVRWTFHRDQRGCGTFGASGHRIEIGEGEGG